jgi:hypothetical protein
MSSLWTALTSRIKHGNFDGRSVSKHENSCAALRERKCAVPVCIGMLNDARKPLETRQNSFVGNVWAG